MSEPYPIPIPRFKTRHHVLILQHPQEPDRALGTARLAHAALPESSLKIGLSWPNLTRALGREAQAAAWAVLYLGSGPKGVPPEHPRSLSQGSELSWVTKRGVPLQNAAHMMSGLEGLVVLDGTWSQVKTLWWRNAWLLKLRRAVLVPKHASLYGRLRREPRRECLSTIESIAVALRALGESETVKTGLIALFSDFLDHHRHEMSEANR